DLGNYEQAKTIYKEVAQDPVLDGTIAAAAAKYRLETMDSYINTKIALKPAPPAPAAPAQELPYGPRRSPEPKPAVIAPQPPANPPAAK
ncbi:MAG: hypothetical protein ABSB91_08080, partial [Sedimentisphaerales bacterium]